MPEDSVQHLLDRSAVSDTVKAYFFALDRYDWNGVAELVTDPFVLDANAPGAVADPLPTAEFLENLKARNGGFTATLHLNPDHIVTIDGDSAHVQAHIFAVHAVGPTSKDTCWGYGFTDVDLVRFDGKWKLRRQVLEIIGSGGDASGEDVFARAAARWAAGEGHN